ncbi:hypothetical protein [Actinomycetospora soli]|uniref:hypothetical protein n=1 Tax=Actinomycetospora soli TaxID=2893887 RepID=UPI001E454546|nr:hypothetical protein [Actinomycetospora soli]MCD2191361.1 hypothetical protein [Actinomycetospora soli]
MPMIKIDEQTAQQLEFAAKMSGSTAGEVIARLVKDSIAPSGADAATAEIYAVYEGVKTTAVYDRTTKRVDITSGPLDGKSFKTPTGAARAIVGHYKPEVSPHRNGWSFWLLDDGTARPLQSIRL